MTIIALFAIAILMVSFIPQTTPFVMSSLLVIVLGYIYTIARHYEEQRIQYENNALVERQQSLEKHQESEDSLQGMIDALPVGLCLVSSKGIIRYVNTPFKQAVGVSLKSGNTYHELQQVSPFYDPMYRSILFEKKIEQMITLEDSTYQLSTHLIHSNESVTGVIVIINNISEAHRARQRQSDFIADVTHELKTPLSAILGSVELVLRDSRMMSEDERTEFISIIHLEAQRMNHLVEDLLELTRIGAKVIPMKPLLMPLHPLVEDVRQLLQHDLERKQLIFHNDVPSSFKCWIDKERFKQVLINLVSNAIRYTPQGTITLRARIQEDEAVIELEDTGIGISSDDQNKIFQRFYRVDKARSRDNGGSGIGLAVTKAIVEGHGGTIRVQSTLQQGTTFVIRLPHSLH